MENYPEKVWIENEDADHNEGCGFWYEWKAFRASKAYIREDLSDTSSSYTYVGKDGKPVLARDLENERDELRAQLSQARNAALEQAAKWLEAQAPLTEHQINRMTAIEQIDCIHAVTRSNNCRKDAAAIRALKSPEQEK